jgi:protein-L-isoaspartate(D-aspartate) O-methyltransferase
MTDSATSPWRQLNLTCDNWRTAEHIAATALGPMLASAQDSGELASWWFVRKGDTWRVRIEAPSRGFTAQATASLQRVSGVRGVSETIYEPETTAFGGPAGMDAAHRLFHADSRHLLGKIARSGRELHRELPVVLATRLLRAARQEWYEQGDCWARVTDRKRDELRLMQHCSL